MTIETDAIKEKLSSVLKVRPDYQSLIEVLLLTENVKIRSLCPFLVYSPTKRGFSALDVKQIDGQDLTVLEKAGILVKFWETPEGEKFYCFADHKTTQEGLSQFKLTNNVEPADIELPPVELPEDLFDCIVGMDDVKELYRKSLTCDQPYNILAVGPPASAKTLFLTEISRLPGARYTLGSSSSKAGLNTFLIENSPRFLLVDEIDKMSRDDYSSLLSVTETGIVTEMKYGRYRTVKLQLWAYAAANEEERIPEEVLSRFEVLYFQPYDESQFVEIGVRLLTKRAGIAPDLAEYIAKKVFDSKLYSYPNIRRVQRIGRICKTKADADKVLETLKKYSRYHEL